ncbi:RcnB family protein [Sphingobium sufflavum]|uniref:RcnB family protein n=1 Tax=Sphingobium sufflavum TaxID=1129547 RepID=UPI001F462283|nr:RcnB family protein [Sphingobium sufflavum]MCE7797287.1 RcnB family protein [Sphingobium sufflavum]
MRKLVLAGLMAGLGGIAAPAVQAENMGNLAVATSVMNRGATQVVTGRPGAPINGAGNAGAWHGAWGPRVNGRWSAGWNAPGGWNSYRRPATGFTLPSYWINPSYYIADYRGYGLPAPAYGYGWSRYYDDAVLTDRYGRVSDVRYGYDWDRFGGYDDGAYADGYDDRGYDDRGYDDRYDENRRRGNNGVAGAVVGGVVGGIAGNVIAGKGNRLPGTILGAGVGAIAGAAIGNASGRNRDEARYAPARPVAPRYDGRGRGVPRGGEPYAYGAGAPGPDGRPASYDGQWVGTWYGEDGRSYSGTYDGRFDGQARGGYAQAAPLPAYRPAPLPPQGYGYSYDSSAYSAAYGASGYSYETVDYAAPIVTTTVTTEETTYATVRKAVRKPVVRKARPKPRLVCCPCGC